MFVQLLCGQWPNVAPSTLLVSGPTLLGVDSCIYTSQCRLLDRISSCSLAGPSANTGLFCLCPNGYFISLDQRHCIILPSGLNDPCSNTSQCSKMFKHSVCKQPEFKCSCPETHFPSMKATACISYPTRIGDTCEKTIHCQANLNNSVCANNRTCICTGEFQSGPHPTRCVNRPKLEQYIPPVPYTQTRCFAYDVNTCGENAHCAKVDRIKGLCRCNAGYSSLFNSTLKCEEVRTYLIRLFLTEEVGVYDYVPLKFLDDYRNRSKFAYKNMELRITQAGIDAIFDSFKDLGYLNNELFNLSSLSTESGIKAEVLINLLDRSNLTGEYIVSVLKRFLNGTNGEVGNSKLRIGLPMKKNFFIEDINECDYPHLHDCSSRAWCINYPGSYMCSCKSQYDDRSPQVFKRPGIICENPKDAEENLEACSDGECNTSWGYITLPLLIITVLLLLVGFEIFSKRREMIAENNRYKQFLATLRKSEHSGSTSALAPNDGGPTLNDDFYSSHR